MHLEIQMVQNRNAAYDRLEQERRRKFFNLLGALDYLIGQQQIKDQMVIKYVQQISKITDDMSAITHGDHDRNLDKIVAQHTDQKGGDQ